MSDKTGFILSKIQKRKAVLFFKIFYFLSSVFVKKEEKKFFCVSEFFLFQKIIRIFIKATFRETIKFNLFIKTSIVLESGILNWRVLLVNGKLSIQLKSLRDKFWKFHISTRSNFKMFDLIFRAICITKNFNFLINYEIQCDTVHSNKSNEKFLSEEIFEFS